MSTLFTAEVSSNHHQNLKRCLQLIDAARAIGADAVKFQLFRIAELFAPEILAAKKEIRDRQAWELPVSFLPELSAYCKNKKIQFSCTPFYLKAVDELKSYVDFYKIASYELMWGDLLVRCAQTGKPIVLSTGMATLEEVRRSVEILKKAGCHDLTLLHGISNYPVLPSDCNLSALETLRKEFGCPVGWSDHSRHPGIIYRAVLQWNASMIEFHIDLDGKGEEYKAGHCWLPDQMGPVIKNIRESELANGTGQKSPAPSELKEREWRAHPTDGLRPLIKTRQAFKK